MPLRPIETKEQRQQRLLQSKQARQAREQEIKQGLSSLPGQAAWMGGLMAPSSGITDYLGLYPEPPRGEGITGETMPSFAENIHSKEYLDALYQLLGLGGDLAIGAGAFYPPALALGAGMKVGSGVGKASKASKAAKAEEEIITTDFGSGVTLTAPRAQTEKILTREMSPENRRALDEAFERFEKKQEKDINDRIKESMTPEELDRLRGVVAEPKIGAKADELLEWKKP